MKKGLADTSGVTPVPGSVQGLDTNALPTALLRRHPQPRFRKERTGAGEAHYLVQERI